jgi:predicted component of type VI protein secretion system
MALRLRGNANTLDRAAERNRQALNETQRDAAEQQRAQAALAQVAAAQQRLQAIKTTPPAAQPQAAQPTAAQPPAAQPQAIRPTQQTTAWADSMTRVAAEFAAGLPNLPPYERAKELARVEALTQTASALLSGTDPREPQRR